MKKKLRLNELEVKSFITDLKLEKNETIKEMKGGTIILVTPICTIFSTIGEITETSEESNGRLGCTQHGTC